MPNIVHGHSHIASQGHLDILKALIAAGADKGQAGDNGYTLDKSR